MSSILVFSSIVLAGVTYTKDVKPIFEKRCMQCHNASWPAKNWQDYETAYANRLVIKRRVWDSLSMPPGSMPFEERRVIKRWVEEGGKK